MSKRKAAVAVNDIIYELDNDDIEISSDDEGKSPKISRLEAKETNENASNKDSNNDVSAEVISLDCSLETDCDNMSPTKTHNGGKTSPEVMLIEPKETDKTPECPDQPSTETDGANVEDNGDKTLNEDIVIDSPHSDLGVVGCENRTPLVTVRFKDQKFAKLYKERVKAFLLHLIKVHDEDSLTGSESETDLELDIWPEDLVDEAVTNTVTFKGVENHVGMQPVGLRPPQPVEPLDGLFFVDTDPGAEGPHEIPSYRQNLTVMAHASAEPPAPAPLRRGPSCFNCGGAHSVRECRLPRDNLKIAQNRQAMTAHTRVGRYHVEDDQKYGHLVAGRISGRLRNALGLKRHELPRHVYRMRVLGYPPGWLEEARISHSGIAMFDSTGKAIQDPEEEEGEVCEPGSKDKFDIKKILDFPGFNVPATTRYQDEAHKFGLPPMSEQDSKLAMLQMLAPNAMKAYKRKKLAFFPSAAHDSPVAGPAEMELDSGDELVDPTIPTVPPLPDEAPPPPPPPPSSPPPPPPPLDDTDMEVVEVMKVPDIPVPDDTWITIDEDNSDDEMSQDGELRASPTLDALEEKKRKLLDALEDGDLNSSALVEITELAELENAKAVNDSAETISYFNSQDSVKGPERVLTDSEKSETEAKTPKDNTEKSIHSDKEINSVKDTTSELSAVKAPNDKSVENDLSSINKTAAAENGSRNDSPSTPLADKEKPATNTPKTNQNPSKSSSSSQSKSTTDTPQKLETPQKTGNVKTTAYGTPVMNIASPFTQLPADDKFAKDICDVIYFENLPNSTGKYKQISKLLKKVKSKVDKIQES